MHRALNLFAALAALACDRVAPAPVEVASSVVDTAALYGDWNRLSDSSEMTDLVKYSAFLAAESGGALSLTCRKGQVLFLVMSEAPIETEHGSDHAAILYRLDDEPARAGKWLVGAGGAASGPPTDVEEAWRGGALAEADSLRVELPLVAQPNRILRFQLKGADSAIAWLQLRCAKAVGRPS
jgi:hypothetical protein